MIKQPACKEVRRQWTLAFDEAVPRPDWLDAHLEGCPACREFAGTSERARREIRRIVLPELDPAADRKLIALLQAERKPRLGFGSVLLPRVSWRPLLPIAGVGMASFVVTLVAAGLLSYAPGEGGDTAAAHSAPRRETRRLASDYEAQLDAWLQSPAPTALPPPRLRAPLPDLPPRDPSRRGRLSSTLSHA